MVKPRHFLVIFALIALLGAGGGAYYLWNARANRLNFLTTPVNRGDMEETVTAAGTLRPLLDVLISSQVSGYVTAWYADFNAKVKKGELLATLLPNAWKAAVELAKGNLLDAQANARYQAVTLRRDKELFARQMIARSEYDAQVARLKEANGIVEIKQAALQTAQTNLSYCRIVSPMDGIVISRNINVGNSVAASLSSPTLFEIGNDLGQMQIDAAVAEADVGKIRVGQPVNLSVDAYLNRTFHGVVYQVRNAPQTQQNVVSYDVMIKVSNADLALKPGMTATVSIVVARRSRVLRISNNALNFHLPGGKKTHPINEGAFCSVYRLRAAGTPALVRVKVGITDGVYTEAVGPLNPGDQLITGIDMPVEHNTPNMASPFGGSPPGRF